MHEFADSLFLAFTLIVSADRDLLEIIGLSLKVSLTAAVLAALIGFPLGAVLAVVRFPGRGAVIILVNALMGLPPVVVGLMIYMLISNKGPFGWLQLLYTPAAMIIAQTMLITPIIAALSRQILADMNKEYSEFFTSISLSRFRAMLALILDARLALITVALAGFGRAIAEVGAVIVVGGNINHLTRVMTTAIALETSKGELALALALGFILLLIALSINAGVMLSRNRIGETVYG